MLIQQLLVVHLSNGINWLQLGLSSFRDRLFPFCVGPLQLLDNGVHVLELFDHLLVVAFALGRRPAPDVLAHHSIEVVFSF